jgi:hypothetical protein
VRRSQRAAVVAAALSIAAHASAAPTPGYPEKVLQWRVQPGETCDGIASSLYGSAKHAPLLLRYNELRCDQGLLPAGMVLVVPESVTELPPASLHSTTPTVKARPPAGEWATAIPGMPLYQQYSVNTLEDARADIRFRDRTRIYLAEHTLVVIYETARASAVSKQRPPSVELQEGEVQAGLAALAGRTVDVTTTGGGRVSAASRDAVLRRSGDRTTVSVFDGSAHVESAGKTVSVPLNFGSSFVRAKPPTPARPLPPAPEWLANSSVGVLLASPGEGRLRASWGEVPKAVKYRLEVARDAAFTDVIVREETPPDVRSFRAEKMPAGRYYLRVRALDGEDFLGLASELRQGLVVEAAADGGHVGDGEIRATPYSTLQLQQIEGVELALDDHDFAAAPARIDLLKQRPSRLRLRIRGAPAESELDVRYSAVVARIETEPLSGRGSLRVRVVFAGIAGIDVPGRVAPRLFLLRGETKREILLVPTPNAPAVWTGSYEQPASADKLLLVDGRGSVLGERASEAPSAPPTAAAKLPQLGPVSPVVALASSVDVPWWSPSLPRQAALGVGTQLSEKSPIGQGFARASGGVGRLGLNASLALKAFGADESAARTAWLGAAYRFGQGERTLWGLSLRAGVPLHADAASTRLEPSFAVGTELGRFSWLGNLGGRVALGARDELPRLQAFAIVGGSYRPEPWLRLYSMIDGHLSERVDNARARAGLAVGVEAGGTFFGGLGLRSSPWSDAGGILFGQLTLGVREH